MKMSALKNSAWILVFSFVAASFTGNLGADLVHAVGADAYTGSGKLPTNYSTITSWSDIGVDGTAQSYTSGPIAGSVDGLDFTYTISVSAANGASNLSLPFSNQTLGHTQGTFVSGQGFTLTIGDVSNLAVVFDGYTQFASSGAQTNEGASVGGNNYTRQGSTVEPAWVLINSPEPSFTYAAIGTTTGNYVEFQFSSVIPEPSGAVFVTIGAIAVVLRRRK